MEPAERGASRHGSLVSETESSPEVDPNDSPFAAPAVEGIPFEKGGDEDQAIRRVIEELDREQRHAGDGR